jgi:hypothetical protein
MELTLKKDFNLRSQAVQHKVMLDAIELLSTEKNYTFIGVKSMVLLSIGINAFEENVVEAINNFEEDSFAFLGNILEPNLVELLKENEDVIEDICWDIIDFKEREMELSMSWLLGLERILDEMSKIDKDILKPLLNEATDIFQKIQNPKTPEETKKEAEELIGKMDEKTQEIIKKFQTAK